MRKTVHPSILSTYETERKPIAQELINFDRGYAQSWAKQAVGFDQKPAEGKTSEDKTTELVAPVDLTPEGAASDGATTNGLAPNGVTADGVNAHQVTVTNGAIAPDGVTRNGVHTNGAPSNTVIINGVTTNGATITDITTNGATPNDIKSTDTTTDEKPVSFQTMYMRNMVYTTGILIHYPPSEIVVGTDGPSKGPKAVKFEEGLTPGMRLPDFQMLNQSDAVPTTIHKVMVTDGRFRVLVFAGDLRQKSQVAKIDNLAVGLAARTSFVNLYKPASANIDSRIEIITIHASPREAVELQELPEVLHPWSEELGWDYWKVFADDQDIHGEHGEAYRKCAVEASEGKLVVVRPDGYVGMVADLSGLDSVNAYFAGFMIPAHS